jgi:S1-C subfamily serine protease
MNARYAFARVAAAALAAAVLATLVAVVSVSLSQRNAHAADRGTRQVPYFGATVMDISAEDCRAAGVSDKVRGAVVIVALDADGPAAAKGLREGDIITELERKPVTAAWQFYAGIRNLNVGQLAQVHAWRDGHDRTIDLVQLAGIDADGPVSGGITNTDLGYRVERLERDVTWLKKRVATLEHGDGAHER